MNYVINVLRGKSPFILVLLVILLSCRSDEEINLTVNMDKEIDYLAFQLFVSGSTEPIGDFATLNKFISDEEIESFFELVGNTIGGSLVSHRRGAVILGPIALDFSNEEVSELIDFSFEMALQYDLAVGFHIDDGMFWARRTDLWQNPENIEWQDWNQTSSESRYVDWVTTRLAPHMCFNCPQVMEAVDDFMTNIAGALKTNYNLLSEMGREELYAGTIVGWETSLDKDRNTQLPTGFHAMSNLGYGPSNPPEDEDVLRTQIVNEYIQFMADPLNRAGLPINKTYSHIAFLSRKLYDEFSIVNPEFGAMSYEEVNNFSPPEVAIGSNIKPGFSTYYEESRFEEIYALDGGSISGWACSEGTNIILGMPPISTGFSMESYLARHYNHGANLVNIFAFNIPALDTFNQILKEASQGPDAIAAYRKFLSGEELIEQ